MERRSNLDWAVDEIQVVKRSADNPGRISGLAAPFNSLSEPILDFREIIRPGAFRKTLRENKNQIKSLWNHDSNLVLGAVRSKTLSLRETDRGLEVEIIPPPTTWAMDAMISMDRGDVSQMSFGFETVKDEWTKSDSGENLRTLIEVRLFEVSPVAFPAYNQTEVGLRDLLEGAGVEVRKLETALIRIKSGRADNEDRIFLGQMAQRLVEPSKRESIGDPATGGQSHESGGPHPELAMAAMEDRLAVLRLRAGTF